MTEERMLDGRLAECRGLAAKIQRAEARLTNAHVDVKQPDQLPRADVDPV